MINYGVPYNVLVKLCTTPIMAGTPGIRNCGTGTNYVP